MLACVVNKAGDSVCSAVVNFNSPSVKSYNSFDSLMDSSEAFNFLKENGVM